MACTNRPAPATSGTTAATLPPQPSVAASAMPTHQLTVNLRGAGSVVGAVRSQPAGIDCVIESNHGGANEKSCTARFPAGAVTLSFIPRGAASIAQFNVTQGDARVACAGAPSATQCTLALTSDAVVEVFPISAPPPPPPR
jgi:hypothetical protein